MLKTTILWFNRLKVLGDVVEEGLEAPESGVQVWILSIEGMDDVHQSNDDLLIPDILDVDLPKHFEYFLTQLVVLDFAYDVTD